MARRALIRTARPRRGQLGRKQTAEPSRRGVLGLSGPLGCWPLQDKHIEGVLGQFASTHKDDIVETMCVVLWYLQCFFGRDSDGKNASIYKQFMNNIWSRQRRKEKCNETVRCGAA